MTNSVIRFATLDMFLAGLTAVALLVPALAAGEGRRGRRRRWGSLCFPL